MYLYIYIYIYIWRHSSLQEFQGAPGKDLQKPPGAPGSSRESRELKPPGLQESLQEFQGRIPASREFQGAPRSYSLYEDTQASRSSRELQGKTLTSPWPNNTASRQEIQFQEFQGTTESYQQIKRLTTKEDANDGTSDLGSEFVKSRPYNNYKNEGKKNKQLRNKPCVGEIKA